MQKKTLPYDSEILPSTENEMLYVKSKIVAFNENKVPFTQSENFISLNFHVKDSQNNIIAGINAIMYFWHILHITVLIVDEDYRARQLGSRLLARAENEAKAKGATLSHLDTFSFHAKDFYLKQGYEVFGILENCPLNHKRYYLKKIL